MVNMEFLEGLQHENVFLKSKLTETEAEVDKLQNQLIGSVLVSWSVLFGTI